MHPTDAKITAGELGGSERPPSGLTAVAVFGLASFVARRPPAPSDGTMSYKLPVTNQAAIDRFAMKECSVNRVSDPLIFDCPGCDFIGRYTNPH
jgi:hypothetical protein